MKLIYAAIKKIVDFVNGLVNGFFSLTTDMATLRWFLVIVTLIGLYVASMLLITPPSEWADAWNKLLTRQMDLRAFAMFIFFTGIFNWDIARILIVVIFPFWAARRIAGIYLADIFERDVKVARDFVWRAAFATTLDTIHIRNGKIAEEDHDSPIVQIGGPGMVQVELDSAILTERPDGSYQIIGPTYLPQDPSFLDMLRARIKRESPKQKYNDSDAILQGFERIRQGVDLRDQAQSKDGKGAEFSARTRDGLMVTAKDVKWVFSIRRRPNLKDDDDKNLNLAPDLPYKYAPSAIRKQVFEQGRTVFKDKEPDRKPDWQKPPLPSGINGMIGGKLGGMISSRNLGEFLAFIGEPEIDRLRTRWDEVYRATEAVTGIPQDKDGNVPSVPKYIPRDHFTKLFDEASGFEGAAEGKGIELRWIGVGTWDMPQPSISEKHREAWQVSRDNMRMSGKDFLNERFNVSRQTELLRLINEVPLDAFYDFPNKEKDFDRLVTKLLMDYLSRLKQGKLEFERKQQFEENKQPVPQTLLNAIEIVEKIIKERGSEAHFFGEY